MNPKPFIKWVGGKRQLLPQLKVNLPFTFKRYFEPFIGGGALFFDLARPGSFISDTNFELINTYKTIANKDKVVELIALLTNHKDKHDKHTKDYYDEIRNQDRSDVLEKLSNVERAARYIYLLKTGFNGVQRTNSKGQNNVPCGDNKSSAIQSMKNDENLWNCHELLKHTEIVHGHFSIVVEKAVAGDLVYFDPPYVPLNATSFTSYTKDGFAMEDQEELRRVIDKLHKNGVYVMISNSYCDETLRLYEGYRHVIVNARRSVNANGEGRGKVQEILVTTYGEDVISPFFKLTS